MRLSGQVFSGAGLRELAHGTAREQGHPHRKHGDQQQGDHGRDGDEESGHLDGQRRVHGVTDATRATAWTQ